MLDEYWEHIFEEELAAWMRLESDWPAPRTRAMFDEWFSAELTESVHARHVGRFPGRSRLLRLR